MIACTVYEMWKWYSVVLLYLFYLELASEKSTEIKTPFLGLETCDTDTNNQDNLGKFWYSMQMRF